MKLQEQITVGGKSLSISTGHVAKQADGAVTMQMGETMVLVTACGQREARESVNFLPLTVDYREYTFAAGKIPGGFFKREGRPSENEILICRLTDRSLRPLFPDGYHNETQIIALMISYDTVHEPDTLTITGASTALMISDVPFDTPIAAVKIGRINGELVVNPNSEELEQSDLDLLVASSEEAILMVEAGAKEVDEEVMVQALELGFNEAQPIIQMQRRLAEQIKPQKWAVEAKGTPESAISAVAGKLGDKMTETLAVPGKIERGTALKELKKSIVDEFEDFDEESDERTYASAAFDEIKKKTFREGVFRDRKRFDGRAFDEVRAITCELDFLPRAHGSAIFTRGETQALVSTTLGTKSDAQIMDELGGEWKKRFMLHYNFPPFSVGEVRFMRGPGRREIGHGALAARALKPILPPEDEFPYTLRVVSDILESNGSSSMASVCGGSLSMMAAGVPTKAPVAGIAMGLLKDGDDVIILSDIAGEEDHYGDMDFKVAGTSNGITALQMDIKIAGVTMEILRNALAQAKAGREHILSIMASTIDKAREELSPYAPRMVTIHIDPSKIRDVIGKGGSVIRSIIEETGAEIDVEDDGTVMIYSPDAESLEAARKRIEEITEEAEVNKVYIGKVVSITDFGAFVQILPSTQGLLHISEIANYRVAKVEDEINIGEDVKVKVIEIDRANGKVRLSRKALMEQSSDRTGQGSGSGSGGGDRHGGGGGRSSGGANRGGNRSGGNRGGGGGSNRGGGGGGRGPNRSGGSRGGSDRSSGGGGGDFRRNSAPRQNQGASQPSGGNDESEGSGQPRFRSRRGPQHMSRNDGGYNGGGNTGQGSRSSDEGNNKGNVRGGNNYNSSSYSPNYNDSNSVRFPGDLGPNPLKPGGGRKKY